MGTAPGRWPSLFCLLLRVGAKDNQTVREQINQDDIWGQGANKTI